MNKTNITTFALLIAILTAVIAIGIIPAAFATPSQNVWNYHYYEYIESPGISWTDAKTAAESRTYNGINGHLVTITNEREFLPANTITNNGRAWIGLTDEITEGQYKWVTGEPFSYTNWNTGQPSAGTNKDYVEMPDGFRAKWTDSINNNTNITGYVVEYLPPNAEPVKNPENGNYYQFIYTNTISWNDAKAAAESRTYDSISGHLVTITTASENEFVNNLLPSHTEAAWIGLTDETTEGTFKWVTGEPYHDSDWDSFSPSADANKDYVSVFKHTSNNAGTQITWNNNEANNTSMIGYVVEYSTSFLNPENAHYYQYVNDPDITWKEAKEAAETYTHNGATGHLVTITSESENTFVSGLVPDESRTWMGLTDEITEGQYKWVTDEPFVYSNWDTGQPDNANGNEHYVQFRGYSDKWNDIENDPGYINGYVIEYDFPLLNPKNGHYYEYISDPDISWTDAKTAAENSTYNGVTGHLVTITSANENDFVGNLVPDDSHSWIGFSDKDANHTYRWVTKELYYYTNWDSGQPSSTTDEEDYVEFRGSNNKWADSINNNTNITGYVIEYDFPLLNPENGHYYEYFLNGAISWPEAKEAAETHTYNGVTGHLVTITSASENEFVKDLLPVEDFSVSTWIGLTDKDTEGTYQWVTGEPFNYSNWDTNQPDDHNNEDHVELLASNGKWNDGSFYTTSNLGYVVEYTPYVLNPQNGHYYQYVADDDITWEKAKAAAETYTYNGVTGYLATITSSSENTFVDNLVPDDSHSWIGLSDTVTKWAYAWVTGESLIYTNWNTGQPSAGTDEDYVEFIGSNGKWNNIVNDSDTIDGYIIEYGSNPVLNTQNRHYYQYVIDDDITWTDAKKAAENSTYNGASGYLVTITTANENEFVDDLVPDDSHSWLGLTDETTEGTYKWVTDESYSYRNWDSGQPSDGINEDYVKFIGSNDKWDNIVNDDNTIDGYIIEYTLPTVDPVLNPANGHYYEYVIDAGISWTDAKTVAENSTYNGASGYLVTITSQSENDFVAGLHPSDFRPWIGLTDETTEGTYQWVTDEPYSYSNWSPHQPDNHNDNEDYVQFLGYNDKWNDLPNDYNIITGYIIEYDVPPILNPTNGHYYRYISDHGVTWTDAKAAAESKEFEFEGVNGYLVTITSQSENDFVKGLLPHGGILAWIGLTDEVTEGDYKWVTNEPFVYSSWDIAQPDDHNNQDYVAIYGNIRGNWYDYPNNSESINGYIVEYHIPDT